MLIKLLAGKNRNITLVVDDKQAIYGFRGVKIEFLMEFRDFYKVKVIKLEQNYRSTKEIVKCGNKLIENNKIQIKKVLFTNNEQGYTRGLQARS